MYCSRLINIKQSEDSLLDYVKRFKQQRDILVSQLGKRFLDHFVEQLEEYRLETDTAKQDALKKGAFERWLAYLIMKGADWTKYGSILKNMVTQYSLGNDQYPKTLEVAVDVLTEHRFDAKYNELRKANKKKEREEIDSKKEASFAQKEKKNKEMVCHCCGKTGHIAPKCNKRDEIPRKEWYVNKRLSMLADAEDKDKDSDDASEDTTNTTRSNRRSGGRRNRNASRGRARSRRDDDDEDEETDSNWSAFQTGGKIVVETGTQLASKMKSKTDVRATNLNEVIVLDSGSTIKATFKTKSMVGNVQTAVKPLVMNTNGGTLVVKKTGEIPHFGQVWYDPRMMANILGLYHMTRRYRVTMDSAVENSLCVHMPDGIVKFKATQEGLYVWKPTDKFKSKIETLKQKERQLETRLSKSKEGMSNLCTMQEASVYN